MRSANPSCDEEKLDLALGFIEKAKEKGVNFYLPVDIVVADEFSADANTKVVDVDEIPADWEGMDIGPKTREIYAEVIKKSKLVVWNGPMGVFEMEPFCRRNATPSPKLARKRKDIRSSAAAIRRRPSRSSSWRTRWTTSPPAAAHRWSSWRVKHSGRSGTER